MSKKPLETNERQKVIEARLKSLGLSMDNLSMGGPKNFISTGITEIDIALGDIPGLADGSVVEFIGESQSGKTHAALKCAAECQRKGKRVAFLAIENSFFEPRAKALGVDTTPFHLFELYENIGEGEKWGELAKMQVQSGEYGLVIIDSVTAMIPSADYDKSLEDEAKFGAHARMSGRLTQKLTELCAKTKTTVILINQYRYGSGAVKNTYVKKPTGGESIGFYAHTRLAFSKINGANGIVYNDKGDVIGGKTQVKILKNRYGAPHEEVIFNIFFSEQESDPLIEFLMRAKSKYAGYIKESRGKLSYTTDDGEVLESKDKKEFIRLLIKTPAPQNKTRNDTSINAFEYICGRIKYSDIMIEKLMKILESDTEDLVSNIDLSKMSNEEVDNIFQSHGLEESTDE